MADRTGISWTAQLDGRGLTILDELIEIERSAPILINTERTIAHERRGTAPLVGLNSDQQLAGRYVAAICPRCGGWTMMYGEATSRTAKEWTRAAYVGGDMIVFWKNPVSLGMGCPHAERRPRERTCDQ